MLEFNGESQLFLPCPRNTTESGICGNKSKVVEGVIAEIEAKKIARTVEENLVIRMKEKENWQTGIDWRGCLDRHRTDKYGWKFHPYRVATIGTSSPWEAELVENIVPELEGKGRHKIRGLKVIFIDCSSALKLVPPNCDQNTLQKKMSKAVLNVLLQKLEVNGVNPCQYDNIKALIDSWKQQGETSDASPIIFTITKELSIGELSIGKRIGVVGRILVDPIHVFPIFNFGEDIFPLGNAGTYPFNSPETLPSKRDLSILQKPGIMAEVNRFVELATTVLNFDIAGKKTKQLVENGEIADSAGCGPYGRVFFVPEIFLFLLRMTKPNLKETFLKIKGRNDFGLEDISNPKSLLYPPPDHDAIHNLFLRSVGHWQGEPDRGLSLSFSIGGPPFF